jgi:hypothetical protein
MEEMERTGAPSPDVDGLLQQISERDQRIADLQETVADMAILVSRNNRASEKNSGDWPPRRRRRITVCTRKNDKHCPGNCGRWC